MKKFTALFKALDSSTKATVKKAALKDYFAGARAENATWALYFLLGNKLSRRVKTTELRQWVAEETNYPLWLIEDCYERVGDLAETLALLLPKPTRTRAYELEELVNTIQRSDDIRKTLQGLWQELDADQTFIMHKMLTGGFRVGVQKKTVANVLAELVELPQAAIAQRLVGDWEPTVERYQGLFEQDIKTPTLPYPFCLAYPLDRAPKELGDISAWHFEWKWDGIRGQIIKREGEVLIWSRGEEAITEQFPELAELTSYLPDGTALDGEILAWNQGPDSFSFLQKRLGRKSVSKKLQKEYPVAFMAYDVLEWNGCDIREQSYQKRRELLLSIEHPFLQSEGLQVESWKQAELLRDEARGRRVEGLMLKHLGAPYEVGRKKGNWWKWKVEPLSIDAVLVYAQAGHGRRAGLYTDYTFSCWKEGQLVPVGKAYSGLSDEEFREVDRFIKSHTIDKHGPVRVVQPELVFELAFDSVAESKRHKSGLALRFPRMKRWRKDKAASEANTLEELRALL